MRDSKSDQGFALAGLICFITAAAVLTAIVVPLRVMQSRRETEQELLFRGQEYVRAIRKYQYKYGAYPSSIEDLISRDGFRFIRRQYKDPITGEDFRLINVNADGSLTGSLTLQSIPVSTQQTNNNVNAFGNSGTAPAPGSAPGGGQRAPTANAPNTAGVGSVAGAGGNLGFAGGASGGGSNTGRAGTGGGGVGSGAGNIGGAFGGGGVGTGAGTGGAFGGGSAGGTAPGTIGGAFGSMGNPLGTGTQQQNNNASNRGTGTGAGATPSAPGAPSAIPSNGLNGQAAVQISPGIAGVASESTKTSVMIYNEKEKYNEWEFVAPVLQAAANQGANGPNSGGNRGNGAQGGARGATAPLGNNGVGQIGGQGIGNIGGGGFGGGTNPLGGGAPRGGPAGPAGGPGGGTPFGGGGPIAPGGGNTGGGTRR